MVWILWVLVMLGLNMIQQLEYKVKLGEDGYIRCPYEFRTRALYWKYYWHGWPCKLPLQRCPPLRAFFFNFVMYLKRQSSIRWFSHNWLQNGNESRKKNRIFLYYWLPTGTYHKNLAIWIIIIIEIWQIWANFSMENPLHRSKSYF